MSTEETQPALVPNYYANRVLDHNDVLHLMSVCGMRFHQSNGEYVILAGVHELAKLGNTIKELTQERRNT